MIAPDMATMLGFVFTDLAVSGGALQLALSGSVEQEHNRITVDSDTSTSDTVLLFATGAAGNEPLTGPGEPEWDAFVSALDAVNLDLAHQIVRDGEGAMKFVEVTVTGAENEAATKEIALAIGNSPLVKTAIAAEDANWGRIVMAVGKAGQKADRDRLAITIGDEPVTANGVVLDDYSEAAGRHRASPPSRDRRNGRRRCWLGVGDDLDVRPDPWLHRDQRRLSVMSGEVTNGQKGPRVYSPVQRTAALVEGCHTSSGSGARSSWSSSAATRWSTMSSPARSPKTWSSFDRSG